MFMSNLLAKNHIPQPIPERYIFFNQFSETDLFLHIPDICWFQKVLSTHMELRVKSTVMELIYKELILKCPDNCIIEKDFIFGVWVFIQI